MLTPQSLRIFEPQAVMGLKENRRPQRSGDKITGGCSCRPQNPVRRFGAGAPVYVGIRLPPRPALQIRQHAPHVRFLVVLTMVVLTMVVLTLLVLPPVVLTPRSFELY